MGGHRKISDHTVARIIFINPEMMLATRIVGLAFAWLLTTLELLIYYHVLAAPVQARWLIWPTALAFFILGFVQAVWLPLTRQKITLWVSCLLILGFIISPAIFGFSSIIFLGWLVLIIVMAIYINERLAWVGYLIMLAAIAITLAVNSAQPKLGYQLASAAAVGLIILITNAIWKVANSSLADSEENRQQASFEQQRLTALINNMVDGVLAVDEHMRIRQYNAAALDILDVNETLTGKPLTDYLKPLGQTEQKFDLISYLRHLKRAEIRTDLKLKYNDESIINLYLAAAPVHLGYGRHGGGFTLILRDITREKSLEEERDEFISVVSHELRTPIAIAEGNISNAQFVLQNAKSANRAELVEKSMEEAHHQVLFLAGLINDLSTLSRAERGKLEVEVGSINTTSLLEELLDNYKPDATAKGLSLRIKHSLKLPNLSSSELYVREILQNFITNAIKYTEKGSITLSAAARPDGVEFAVTDTGIGLSKSDKVKVFDKFFRSEDFRTRKNSGTGLGLYVTMKLARLLNADINIESQLNHGSTFSIFFPDLPHTTGKTRKVS